MIRILLSDDHTIVRRGLAAVLRAEDGFEIVGEAGSPADALARARALSPDVILLDLQYSGSVQRGADIIRALRAMPEPPAVVVLTTYDNDQDVLEAMEAGAAGYLLKDAAPADLAAAIRRGAGGDTAMDPRVAGRLAPRVAPEQLTAREREVLVLVAEGRTNAQIAADLFLSQATVKTHLVHVFEKLQASSRTDAVARARNLGILRPSS